MWTIIGVPNACGIVRDDAGILTRITNRILIYIVSYTLYRCICVRYCIEWDGVVPHAFATEEDFYLNIIYI